MTSDRTPARETIHYGVELFDRHAHLYRVTLTVPDPQAGMVLSLPVWIDRKSVV